MEEGQENQQSQHQQQNEVQQYHVYKVRTQHQANRLAFYLPK